MKKDFDNYIFDLYGTLVDIHTDEEQPILWEKMANKLSEDFESEFETVFLRKRYLEICAEEEKKLGKESGAQFPEIRIEKVWTRLILEGRQIIDEDFDDSFDKEKEELENSDEVKDLCIYFRESSRDKFEVYDGVFETLKSIKAAGKGIFLLSNAQKVFTEKELKDAGLWDYFDDIFISSDKGIKKPQKEFLEQLMKENHLNRDKCVMIGNDLVSDVGVAFKNGVHSFFLNTYDISDRKIEKELTELGIKGSALMPVIVEDGDICKIL
ncbi:HAD family hydrolase [Butyrivibrio sp. YAB3001]|uniref:HAD family hydrolase n=1 Tax=Butyrivibrio sp. YAB3001 TaxID=1520812 RepID=UPI0008F69043|nr:HAD family hydrolase [Butyrivibrio sp. YAB3001]SFC60966.1 putative hydrolase of the HAD superfamily [Butyrivibrio sp. YAB3001]